MPHERELPVSRGPEALRRSAPASGGRSPRAPSPVEPRAVVLDLPFTGTWLTRNSPARRVPSHGSDLVGERYAIDFVAVVRAAAGRPGPARWHTAHVRDWRTALATEPPDRFVGFGLPILAPAAGTVVVAHDGEPDHAARRSPLALLPYAFGQAGRVRQGVGAIAGNHVVLAVDGRFVALVHLRLGSLVVRAGDEVSAGTPLGACGSSGNSTQPHVHVQAMDRLDLATARGVPIAFRSFSEWAPGAASPAVRAGVPGERSVVEP